MTANRPSLAYSSATGVARTASVLICRYSDLLAQGVCLQQSPLHPNHSNDPSAGTPPDPEASQAHSSQVEASQMGALLSDKPSSGVQGGDGLVSKSHEPVSSSFNQSLGDTLIEMQTVTPQQHARRPDQSSPLPADSQQVDAAAPGHAAPLPDLAQESGALQSADKAGSKDNHIGNGHSAVMSGPGSAAAKYSLGKDPIGNSVGISDELLALQGPGAGPCSPALAAAPHSPVSAGQTNPRPAGGVSGSDAAGRTHSKAHTTKARSLASTVLPWCLL